MSYKKKDPLAILNPDKDWWGNVLQHVFRYSNIDSQCNKKRKICEIANIDHYYIF